MQKLPPIEKIAESYTAIIDNRIELHEDFAVCKSSDGSKSYDIRWKDNVYYSNDNSTYWQGYIGYPVIAVLMLKGKLPLNREILKYFKGINWKALNKKHKNKYSEALDEVLIDLTDEEKKLVNKEMNYVYEQIKKLDIELSRKKL